MQFNRYALRQIHSLRASISRCNQTLKFRVRIIAARGATSLKWKTLLNISFVPPFFHVASRAILRDINRHLNLHTRPGSNISFHCASPIMHIIYICMYLVCTPVSVVSETTLIIVLYLSICRKHKALEIEESAF